MMVVNELKVTYFGAEILSRLFTRARETINSRRRGPEKTSIGPDTGNASNSEGRNRRGDEIPMPASPVVWGANVPGDDWRETDSRYVDYLGHQCQQDIANAQIPSNMYDIDVNDILSQCIFPDFTASIEAIGSGGTSQSWY